MQISQKSLDENIVANYSYLATIRTCFRLIVLQGPMSLSMPCCWKKPSWFYLVFRQKNFPIRRFLKVVIKCWWRFFLDCWMWSSLCHKYCNCIRRWMNPEKKFEHRSKIKKTFFATNLVKLNLKSENKLKICRTKWDATDGKTSSLHFKEKKTLLSLKWKSFTYFSTKLMIFSPTLGLAGPNLVRKSGSWSLLSVSFFNSWLIPWLVVWFGLAIIW